jgi:6-phosphogluconolactonase/glucosamine-6-phosphate isomerase/deaminase
LGIGGDGHIGFNEPGSTKVMNDTRSTQASSAGIIGKLTNTCTLHWACFGLLAPAMRY